MTNRITTKDVLLAAADLIEERGLAKGQDATDGEGTPAPTCAGLAIGETALHRDTFFSVMDHLRAYLGVRSITAWNDAPERTQAEVVAALRGAAEA